MRSRRGAGSVRERRPGVWEVRVALGPDPVSGRSRRRSLTVHGDDGVAAQARRRWADQAGSLRAAPALRPGLTVAELLAIWLATDHGRRPSTQAGYRSVARFLTGGLLATRRAGDPSPVVLRAACAAWRQAGCPEPTIAGRVRCLRSALGWADVERVLDRHPLDGMRGPPQSAVRLHAPVA